MRHFHSDVEQNSMTQIRYIIAWQTMFFFVVFAQFLLSLFLVFLQLLLVAFPLFGSALFVYFWCTNIVCYFIMATIAMQTILFFLGVRFCKANRTMHGST